MFGLRSPHGFRIFAAAALFGGAASLHSGASALEPTAVQPAAISHEDNADADAPSQGTDPAQAARTTEARVEAVRQQRGENSLAYALALRAHARSLVALGKFGDAEALARQSLSIVTALRGPGDIQTMGVQSQLGSIITRAGRFTEAEPLLREACQALVTAKGGESPEALNCQTNLAMNLIGQSRDQEAQALLRQVIAIRTRVSGAGDPATLTAKVQLGRVWRDEGNLGPAETILRGVVDARRRSLGDHNNQTLSAIGELASVLVAEHRGAEAEPLYRLVLKERRALLGDNHPDTLLVMDSLARVLAMRGNTDEAEQLSRQALSLQTAALGEAHPNTLSSMNTLAFVLRRKGQPAEAEAMMRRALDLRTKALGPQHASTLATESALAMDVAAQGRLREAEQLLVQVVSARRQQRDERHSGLGADLVKLGYVRLGQPDRAALALEPLRNAVENLRRRRANASFSPQVDIELSRETVSQAGTYRLLADADWASAQARPQDAAALREEAFIALQDAMAGTVTQSYALAAARSAAREASSDLGSLAEERQQLSDRWRALADSETETIGKSADNGSGQPGQIATLERQISAIDAQLRTKAPGYFALTRPEAVSLTDAQALLRPDEAVLIVVPSMFGTHAMVLSRDGLAWNRSSLNRGEMVRIVRQLRSELNPVAVARNNRAFSRQEAYRLYRELIAPLEPALAGKKSLFIAADGALASLPFEVLVASEPAGSNDDPAAMRATAWFGEAHALAQIPSLQTLQFARATNRVSNATPRVFEGYGDPKLRGAAATRGGPSAEKAAVASVSELASLPGTADELRRIASALDAPASTVHLGDDATKTAVEAMDLSHTGTIAFATHGLLPGELQGVDEPGLVFTPSSAAGSADDGFLSASEITQLKLNADLVILSACNSGAGDGENTPPLSGLARSFFYAGARALLVSHWPVYDDVAPRITVQLIGLRHTNPELSLAEALQRATRSIREDKNDPSLAFPSAWAPFVVVGD
jgi:CHAT domain-containing protein